MRAPTTYQELAAKWIVVGFRSFAFFGFIIIAAYMLGYPPKDSTDPIDGRSGLQLFTDAGSGCQYLGNPKGGITPRISFDGKHMGCNP